MHTPSGTSLPVVPAALAPVRPFAYAGTGGAAGTGIRAASDHLPGLESTAPVGDDSVWLHDALLGPHSADIVRYLSLARSTGGPVLDLGSGAGRLAVPFARHGFLVEAVDRDASSLERLQTWGRRIGPQVSRLVIPTCADLAELRLRRTYRLALLAGTMISAVSPRVRPGLLHEIASHLDPGGALALDYTAHHLRGLSEDPHRTWVFQVPRFDGVQEWVVARQIFDLTDMSERITYYAARTGKSSSERVVLTTDKWVIDPQRLTDELDAAGLRVEDRRRHRIDDRTESVLLVCRARA
ncbi:class I SAM-dependent methyltransferase [Streptomyces sp. H27-H1]|uniref:class I SAM-dependent methyltransferase n=1 Tax=Streptomyces sp. H27-H1 TaxID=2996461 RepID=UPI0022713646|nr:class I SAM-dependent methyltransferase [Streptomyces sp. H27-H1]MCY0928841.1 class I SAM-dependent methyltransferase [Streptomyces sp. H27-H1]